MEKKLNGDSTKQYLYGFTINGIQKYIFNTNKLTEIIGGSEIIEYICKDLFKEKLGGIFKAEKLLQSAAGTISYIFEEKSDAISFYSEFPTEVIKIAGNISFNQAIVEIKSDEITKNDLQEISKKLRVERNRPVINDNCGIMTIPVSRRTGESVYSEVDIKTKEKTYFDLTTKLKTESVKSILLGKIVKEEVDDEFPKELSDITDIKTKNYLAIIHADGNGLGKVIQKIINQPNEKKKVAEELKQFSSDLEKATIEAFNHAFRQVIIPNKKKKESTGKQIYPLRPVILGGDDLTAIVRADLAIDFTVEYLKAFEKLTGIFLMKKKIPDLDKLTATAGIVFIKDKYPFHYAAHLSDSICSFAKKESEREYSGLKFYRVQDSFVESYNTIVNNELKITVRNKKSEQYETLLDFNSKTYSIKDIKELQNKLALLKSKEIPIRPIRKLLSLVYDDPTIAQFHINRALNVTKGIDKILKPSLKDNGHIYDLITLDSLTTDN